MKKIISWSLPLICLFCALRLLADQDASSAPQAEQIITVVKHTTIDAVSFNFIAGTPDYTQGDGLVAGASFTTPATGVANVWFADGTVLKAFTVCGRDFASDQEFAGSLKRKTINPLNSAFTLPEVMAHVHSGIAAFSNPMQCLKSAITATKATIDNANWTYFVEIQVGFTTEVIAVKFDY